MSSSQSETRLLIYDHEELADMPIYIVLSPKKGSEQTELIYLNFTSNFQFCLYVINLNIHRNVKLERKKNIFMFKNTTARRNQSFI